jgi:hypothetical protein
VICCAPAYSKKPTNLSSIRWCWWFGVIRLRGNYQRVAEKVPPFWNLTVSVAGFVPQTGGTLLEP